jgi:hypothetical protein
MDCGWLAISTGIAGFLPVASIQLNLDDHGRFVQRKNSYSPNASVKEKSVIDSAPKGERESEGEGLR